MSTSGWQLFKSAAVNSVLSLPVEVALEQLRSLFRSELEEISSKLDRLLENPLKVAGDNLELAQNYCIGSIEYRRCLEKARDQFHSASANLEKVGKAKALMSASACSALLGDTTAAKFFHKKAIEAAVSEHRIAVEGYESSPEGRQWLSGLAAAGLGVGSVIVAATGVGLPLAAAMLGGAVASGSVSWKAASAVTDAELDLNELAYFGREISVGKKYAWKTVGEINRYDGSGRGSDGFAPGVERFHP